MSVVKWILLGLYVSAAWLSGYLCGIGHPFSTHMAVVSLCVGCIAVASLMKGE